MTENYLTGDWDGVLRKLERLGDSMEQAVVDSVAESAYLAEKTLVEHVQNQDLPWKDLNDVYKRYKAAKGLSTQKWIATSTTLQSFTVEFFKNGAQAFVGVLRNAAGKSGEVVEVAKIMEYGTKDKKIPERPLFRPTYKELRPKFADIFKKSLSKVVSDFK